MRERTGIACLFVLSIVAGVSAYAQGTKNTGTAPAPFGVLADGLTRQQRDAVQKVNHYFNQLAALKGTFTQTNSDNKRLRGRILPQAPRPLPVRLFAAKQTSDCLRRQIRGGTGSRLGDG